VSERNDRKFS